jgi:hypothetical protein
MELDPVKIGAGGEWRGCAVLCCVCGEPQYEGLQEQVD